MSQLGRLSVLLALFLVHGLAQGASSAEDFFDQTLGDFGDELTAARVRATPVFAFFNLDGRLVKRYTGATKDPQEFLWLGQYVVEGVYEQMSFTRFKRQKRQSTGRP